MDLVVIVVVLALLQYIAFAMLVGRAREKYSVAAPATTGDPIFERYYRVQMNTLEQLIGFLPAIYIFSQLGNPTIAAGLGLVYIVGRMLYLRSYISDPKSRGVGFILTFLPTAFMLIASLVLAILNLF